MKSRYIPVHNVWYAINDNVHWWKDDSPFYYPNVLINLQTIEPEKLKPLMRPDTFLLTDSGGFQVISGQCKMDWKESLLKQISLNATKIFSFDTPPVKQQRGSKFTYHTDEKIKEIIEKNFDIALMQARFLRDNYPEYHKRFCYILHGKSKDQLDYNLKIIDEKLGLDKYSKAFPGGIVYAAKTDDILYLALSSSHAKKYFIDKGCYVHFLGIGSFNRMIILIRNSITTFDSSNALNGASRWNCYNPISSDKIISITKDFHFTKSFCCCPVCQKIDYNELLKQNEVLVGRWFIAHNLWSMLKTNIFLDSLRKDKYTEIVKETINPNKRVMEALNFIDDCDKMGFEKTCDKYRMSFKKDETKQQELLI